jgi:hypothetical protein
MCWRRLNPENQAKSQQWALNDDKASLFLARNPLGNRFECGFDFPRSAAPLKVRPPIFIVRQAPRERRFKKQNFGSMLNIVGIHKSKLFNQSIVKVNPFVLS